jgi:competence protein ComEC
MKKLRVVSGLAATGVILGGLMLVLFLVQFAVTTTDSKLTVSFLDVGQGDGTLIETPAGVQVLVDGGSYGSVDRSLSRMLPFYDRSLDVVIATHADSDHIGGLVSVLADYDVGRIIIPSRPSKSAAYTAFRRAVEEEVADGAVVQIVSRGDVIVLEDEAYLRILFPLADYVPEDSNATSLVFSLVYGETSWLLTGDSPQVIERLLARQFGAQMDIDVLQVGHHGSDTSSAATFLAATSPAFAVISAGVDNPYGHPTDEVLGRLVSIGAEVLCTCEDGTVTLTSDGENIRQKK